MESGITYWNGLPRVEWAAQGGDGVIVPGGVHEMTGHGTRCHGVFEKVVRPRLVLILEVFSSLNHSVIGIKEGNQGGGIGGLSQGLKLRS